MQDYEEVHLVFDRYDLPNSLKTATRERRTGSKTPIAYHVTDTTSIGNLTGRQFLSSTKTKDELTVYLAEKCTRHFQDSTKTFVVTAREEVYYNKGDFGHLKSSQEEADTRIMLHSLNASSETTKLHIHSPDTDVLVLALRRYPRL